MTRQTINQRLVKLGWQSIGKLWMRPVKERPEHFRNNALTWATAAELAGLDAAAVIEMEMKDVPMNERISGI